MAASYQFSKHLSAMTVLFFKGERRGGRTIEFSEGWKNIFLLWILELSIECFLLRILNLQTHNLFEKDIVDVRHSILT